MRTLQFLVTYKGHVSFQMEAWEASALLSGLRGVSEDVRCISRPPQANQKHHTLSLHFQEHVHIQKKKKEGMVRNGGTAALSSRLTSCPFPTALHKQSTSGHSCPVQLTSLLPLPPRADGHFNSLSHFLESSFLLLGARNSSETKMAGTGERGGV